MQDFANGNYSDYKLYGILHSEYKAIAFNTNTKEATIRPYMPDPPLAGAASLSLQ